jgi:hypothetical protein
MGFAELTIRQCELMTPIWISIQVGVLFFREILHARLERRIWGHRDVSKDRYAASAGH